MNYKYSKFEMPPPPKSNSDYAPGEIDMFVDTKIIKILQSHGVPFYFIPYLNFIRLSHIDCINVCNDFLSSEYECYITTIY